MMPGVWSGSYPEYVAKVSDSTITQEELQADANNWTALDISSGDTVHIKLAFSETGLDNDWDKYDATMDCANNDKLRYTNIVCQDLSISTGSSTNYYRIQFGNYNQEWANPGLGQPVVNPVTGNNYQYCKIIYVEEEPLTIYHTIDNNYISSDIARTADVPTLAGTNDFTGSNTFASSVSVIPPEAMAST